MTAINTPQDKYNAVWIIFFIMGLGTLLPWNFFITATMYFTDRLKTPSSMNLTANGTAITDQSERNVLEAKFSSTMTLCAMVPLLIFTCLNSFIHQKIPQKLRIVGSFSAIFLVFLITAALVKVEMDPLPFFVVTMIKIVCINSFGAMLQGGLFGLAGLLPASYTTPIMSGQGLAGTFAAVSMICAIANSSALTASAFGYFITACVVILLAIVSYLILPKLEFFQYYSARPSSDEENKMDLLKKDAPGEIRAASYAEEVPRAAPSVINIFKQIWVMALSVCCIFAVTIATFPAVTVDVKTIADPESKWKTYFIPVSCFLIFNVMDWAGRSLTAVCMWPGKDSVLLPILVVLRVVFIPLFMLCNVQPRTYTPVVFEHDAWYILFMILFAFSNGYLASLCMCFGPKKVALQEAETAGAVMAFFLALGLALGAAMSFIIRTLV